MIAATDLLRQRLSELHPISDASWKAAIDHLTTKSWKAGETVFAAGDSDQRVYFIADGLARYYYIDPDGRERNKSITGPGGALASMDTAINGVPSPFFTEALTELRTVAITYAHLVMLSEKHSDWAVVVRRLLEILILKKERREAEFLMLSARQRYENFIAEFGSDAGRISLRQVAMYLGITDVALSRIRREMGMTNS